jgi:hypothetical protein
MKEDKITKRIKELQNDRRFMFKLTDDIIALVYRTAVEDCAKEKKDPDKAYKVEDVVVKSSKDLNKNFGSKRKLGDTEAEWERKEKETKIKSETYADVLKYIENHSDLMDVYIYVKEKAKEYYDTKTPNHRGCP